MFVNFLTRPPFSIKTRMVGYLLLLLATSAWSVGNFALFVRGLVIVAVYVLADVGWTFLRNRKLYVPNSSFISGLIIALVLAPQASFWLVLTVPFIAVFSKQVLHIGFHRHVFNPAVLSLVLASFVFTPAVSWWGVSGGGIVLWLIAGAALMIITGQRRWHEVLPFFVSYLLVSLAFFARSGASFSELLSILKNFVWDGTVLFFASVMLIEPMTSQFPKFWHRVVYAIMSAAGAIVFGHLNIGGLRVDPLFAGLLASNFVSSLLFLRKRA